MSFFVTKKDHEAALSKLALLEGENSELQASLNEAKDLNAQDAQTIAEMRESITNLTADLSQAKQTISEKENALAKLQEKSQLEIEVAEQSASVKATAMLAEAGHPPIEIEATNTLTKEQIQETFQSMPQGAERTKFYQQHRSILKPI
jgi:predicted RNase H-like nuclease (RuvC/YqgF family)